jgi:hypothetical protein
MKGTAEWLKNGENVASAGPPTPSRRRSFGHDARIIGYVTMTMAVHPGISRAHKRLCKKDLRFAKVYEAWDAYRDVVIRRSYTRQDKMIWSEEQGEVEPDNDDDDSDTSDEEEDEGGISREDLKRTVSEKELGDDVEKPEGFFAERRAHSKALHKKVGDV